MDSLIELIKEENYSYIRITADAKLDEKFYSIYQSLSSPQKRFFRLSKADNIKEAENNFQINITIPDFKTVEKDIGDLSKALEMAQQILNDEIVFFIRVFFHFSVEKYKADPDLPVALEEKRSGIGKIVLAGVRVTFPEYKEFDSVILDVQNCKHCGNNALDVQVISEKRSSYSLEFLKNSIKNASEFSKSFVKTRIKEEKI